MTLPRSRWVQAAILLTTCGVMAAFPLVNHFRNDAYNRDTSWFALEIAGDPERIGTQAGKNKDYPLWYATGRAFMAGEDYYPPKAGTVFPFMYPPFAGLMLGLLSELGPNGMLIVLILLNVACVAVAVELSVRLVAGTGDVPLLLRIIPAAICLFFINDMFLLGQPNLGLLCLVLGGLMLVRAKWEIPGGALLAAAAALKAFPAVVIVYLVWRRYWVAALSMVGFTALFVLPLPATVRGWEASKIELKRWADGMLFKQGAEGFGQRPEQSLGWRNQSLFGIGHRLLRPVNAYADELALPAEHYAKVLKLTPDETAAVAAATPPPRELFVNVLSLDNLLATMGILLTAGLLGLGFVAVMPAKRLRTRTTDALEFAILAVLVTICTPYTFSYYFVWLVFPLTVLVHCGLMDPDRRNRRIGWFGVAICSLLLVMSAPYTESRWMMAYGMQFWAALTVATSCGWVLAHPSRSSTGTNPSRR